MNTQKRKDMLTQVYWKLCLISVSNVMWSPFKADNTLLVFLIYKAYCIMWLFQQVITLIIIPHPLIFIYLIYKKNFNYSECNWVQIKLIIPLTTLCIVFNIWICIHATSSLTLRWRLVTHVFWVFSLANEKNNNIEIETNWRLGSAIMFNEFVQKKPHILCTWTMISILS